MAKTALQNLLEQKAEIEKQIAEAQRTQRAEAIAQVKALMAEYGLTLADIGSRASAPTAKPAAAPRKVAAKYRNPATGETWSGRGLKPKWLNAALAQGRSIGEFAL